MDSDRDEDRNRDRVISLYAPRFICLQRDRDKYRDKYRNRDRDRVY